MQPAIKGGLEDDDWIDADQHIFMWKEILTFLALLCTLIALIPLTNILVATSFFEDVAQPLPNRYVTPKKKWWKMAWVNTLIAGLSFPILAAAGGFILFSLIPQLNMLIANGVMVWFLGNVLIYLVIFGFWYRKAKKDPGVTMYDMGISFDQQRTVINWRIIGKTILLAGILFGFMYLLVVISERLWSKVRFESKGKLEELGIRLIKTINTKLPAVQVFAG